MRKHTKRKHWPTGHMLMPKQVDSIVMPVHTSLMAIEFGAGTLANRHTLAAFLNIAGVCASRMGGTAQETRHALDAAKYALVDADRRYLSTGRIGFNAQQMRTIRHAITLGDILMRRANSATVSYAVEWVAQQNDKTPETLGSMDEPMEAAA